MMREAGIQIVRLGHLAWDTFEPTDGEFRFEWFDEVMDLMHDNGIRREVLDPLLEAEIELLGIDRGVLVPPGVMARAVDDRHVLYLNLDADPKPITFEGKATSVLHDTDYEGGFTLGPYDADFVELG